MKRMVPVVALAGALLLFGQTRTQTTQNGSFSITYNGASVTAGADCAYNSPCIFQINYQNYYVQTPVVLQLGAQLEGEFWGWLDGNGNFQVGYSTPIPNQLSCSPACQQAPLTGIGGPPEYTLPLFVGQAASGLTTGMTRLLPIAGIYTYTGTGSIQFVQTGSGQPITYHSDATGGAGGGGGGNGPTTLVACAPDETLNGIDFANTPPTPLCSKVALIQQPTAFGPQRRKKP